MACVENIPPVHIDSEREEGEIVDELDELSDISSEEEYLLRQRLQVLENFNNVLERKKAKRSSFEPGKDQRQNDSILRDLSEISGTELDEPIFQRDFKEQRHSKTYHKPKRRKLLQPQKDSSKKEYKKKMNRLKRKVLVTESSDESDDEYRNKRRKLENAVVVNKVNIDKSSLKARLKKMLCGSQQYFDKPVTTTFNDIDLVTMIHNTKSSNRTQERELSHPVVVNIDNLVENNNSCKTEILNNNPKNIDDVDSAMTIVQNGNAKENTDKRQIVRDSDEDLELLREHALKTKASKMKLVPAKNVMEPEKEPLLCSEDEDSDTAELRMICLKSALLKKAIEMKQKQKQRKRLSQSSNLNDELMNDQNVYMNQLSENNNTDIESVDMDIGSDADDKGKEYLIENATEKSSKEDDFEEDEDLLRAKLLTSLSKNLPNLVDPNMIKNIDVSRSLEKDKKTLDKQVVQEKKKFIIKLGDSDSETEHEATKNLTKMHLKLSEQAEFQQKLDQFLKSTRLEVEKNKLPDVVQQPPATPMPVPKTKEKFVPKTVKHLPKSVQLEYKSLVKRMAELEKMKNARQASMNIVNKTADTLPTKVTLKPRNITIDTKKIDAQIALSRKNIAEESVKMLRLKEEATKLSQKYKIVATELRNISTAISLNKREQRSAQLRLSKIRVQHQLLLKSTTTTKHSKTNGTNVPGNRITQKVTSTRLQKENDPATDDFKNPHLLKAVQVSVVNDLKEKSLPSPKLSVQIDVTSNKKTIMIPTSIVKDGSLKDDLETRLTRDEDPNCLVTGNSLETNREAKCTSNWGSKFKTKHDDYQSPLQALGAANWEEDPNAVLCPFEVGGNCKDPDCKYLHPRVLSEQ